VKRKEIPNRGIVWDPLLSKKQCPEEKSQYEIK
jgi:hypothetical protein